jgi:tetratricopeptide (TPR) repeat protein
VTVVLDNRNQLAGPRGLEFLPPPVLGSPREPIMRLAAPAETEIEEQTDFHLAQARELVERHSSSPAAWARLAQAELISGTPEAAIGAAQAALKHMPEPDGGPALAASIVLAACGKAEEAEAGLRRLDVSQGPLVTFRAALAAERGDFDEALQLISRESSYEAHTLRAWIRLEQENYPEAIRWYRQALRIGGPSPAVLTNIGYAHAVLGQRERAVRDTQQALSLNPSERSRVGLNLFTYYLDGGESDRALKLVRALEEEAPRDIDLRFAEAHLHLSEGRLKDARRALRRARTSLWAHLSEQEQAELVANVAFVDWRTEKRTKAEAIEQILDELKRIDYASVRIVEMLPTLLDRFSEAELFKRLLARTHQAHAEDPLYSLEMHAAVLEHRFEDATEISIAWAKSAPLTPAAASAATYLLTDAVGDPARAVEIGLPAARRMPGARALNNNVAYALALLGNPSQGRRLVPDDTLPQTTATRALIALRLGAEDEAVDLYQQAFSRAKRSGDSDLPALVSMYAETAIQLFAKRVQTEDLKFPKLQTSEGWADQPRFEIAFRILDRAGVENPALGT